jgi:hypothetical protein
LGKLVHLAGRHPLNATLQYLAAATG